MKPQETARQVAYVSEQKDFDAMFDFWVNVMHVGPWYLFDVELSPQTFRGVPTGMTSLAGLAMHGGVQIELLCATNEEPSPYTDWLAYKGGAPRGGLFHHFLIDSEDHDSTYDRLVENGFLEGYRGVLGDGRNISYLDGRDVVGSYVEIIQQTPSSRAVQAAMRRESESWDGLTAPRRDYLEFARDAAAAM